MPLSECLKYRLTAAIATLMVAGLPVLASAQPYAGHRHTLYIDGNIVGGTGNAVLAYDIRADGSLKALPGSPYLTNGEGFYDPSFGLGTFDIDQELALAGNVIYAVNPGSNSISAFWIDEDGGLFPVAGQPFHSHGSTPVSLGLHGPYVVTVDSAADPAQANKGYIPGLSVSAVLPDGGLLHIPHSEVPLPGSFAPNQALTTDTGPFVFTTEFPNPGVIDVYYQFANGQLYHTDRVTVPPDANGSQPLPLGLWTNPKAPYLYAGLPNTSEVATFRVTNSGTLKFVSKAGNSGAAVCWLRVSADGRYLYTADSASNAISVYDLSNPAAPVEIQYLPVGGEGGVWQFSLTPDGDFLYLLQAEGTAASVGHSNKVYALKVDKHTGKLTLLDALTTQLPLPPKTRPIGIAIR